MNTHGPRPVLPRPDVAVNKSSQDGTDVVISRDGKAKSYSSEKAHGSNEGVKEIVEKILNDGHTAEWLP